MTKLPFFILLIAALSASAVGPDHFESRKWSSDQIKAGINKDGEKVQRIISRQDDRYYLQQGDTTMRYWGYYSVELVLDSTDGRHQARLNGPFKQYEEDYMILEGFVGTKGLKDTMKWYYHHPTYRLHTVWIYGDDGDLKVKKRYRQGRLDSYARYSDHDLHGSKDYYDSRGLVYKKQMFEMGKLVGTTYRQPEPCSCMTKASPAQIDSINQAQLWEDWVNLSQLTSLVLHTDEKRRLGLFGPVIAYQPLMPYKHKYEFDESSRLSAYVNHGRTRMNYNYSADRLSSIEVASGGKKFMEWSIRDGNIIQDKNGQESTLFKIERAKNGRIKSIAKDVGPEPSYQFDYDRQNRISKIIITHADSAKPARYDVTYDIVGFIHSVSRNGLVEREYNYNACGDLLSMSRRESNGDKVNTRYAANRVLKALDFFPAQGSSESTTYKYEFDHHGNWIKRTSVSSTRPPQVVERAFYYEYGS